MYMMFGVKFILGVMGNDDECVDFCVGSMLLIVVGCFNDVCDDGYVKVVWFFYEWIGLWLCLVGWCLLVIELV